MRVRTNLGPFNPIIRMHEYKWTGSSPSFKRTTNVPSDKTASPVYWNIPNGYRTFVEYMEDEVGKDSRFRDCLHTFETNEFGGSVVPQGYAGACFGNAFCYSFGSTEINRTRALGPVPDFDMDAYADQALAFMLPTINQGSSLVNYLLELKDVKRMDPRGTWQRLRRRQLSLRALYKDKRVRKRFLKETTHRLTSAHLQAQFGVVPLVGDTVQMIDELMSLDMKLKRLKQFAGRNLTRHYRRLLPESDGKVPNTSWKVNPVFAVYPGLLWHPNVTYVPDIDFQNRYPVYPGDRWRWKIRPTYHATMRYNYTLPSDMGEVSEKIATYADSLGVRLDPSIVWNALPYSFMVDWVVDVSGFLSSFARDNWPIETKIQDFCHSLTWSKEAELYCMTYPNPGYTSGDWPPLDAENSFYSENRAYTVYRCEQSSYLRKGSSPSTHVAIAKRPKLKQAALSMSLLLNKTRKLTSRQYLNLDLLPPLKKRVK